MKKFNKLVIEKETNIDKEIFKYYFGFQTLSILLRNLYHLNDETKNNNLVNLIKSGLSDFKNEIEKMTEDEIKTEKLYEIVDTAGKILIEILKNEIR